MLCEIACRSNDSGACRAPSGCYFWFVHTDEEMAHTAQSLLIPISAWKSALCRERGACRVSTVKAFALYPIRRSGDYPPGVVAQEVQRITKNAWTARLTVGERFTLLALYGGVTDMVSDEGE